jgi:hypothetical protein
MEGKGYQGIEAIVRYRRDLSILQSVLTLGRRWAVCSLSEQYIQIPVPTLCVPPCYSHAKVSDVLFGGDATAAWKH